MFSFPFQTYTWNESERSVILSSFFWGYAAIHVPAGFLIKKYGPKIFLTGGFLFASLLTVFTSQIAALGNWQLTCVGRVLQGVAQGFIYPGCHDLISKWVPPAERAQLTSVIYSGWT